MNRAIPAALAALMTVSSASAASYQTLYSAGQIPKNLSVSSIATASVLNVRNFGATGNGITDDTAAFAAAITQVNAQLAAGTPATLYIPAGVYFINGATSLPTFSRGGSLVGDGPHKTYVRLGPSYAGDLFSWSEAWALNAYNGTSLSPGADQAGPTIEGLSVLGDRGISGQQNAFVFYDRDDFITMRDVHVYFLKGRGLYMGVAKNVPGHAYVRESKFTNLLFWQCGNASVSAVEITSVGPAGEDATNELSFYGLDVIGPTGRGLVIRNTNASIPVRLIRFFGLRAEGGGANAGDLVTIGDSTLTGGVNNVQIYGFESNNTASGYTALRFTASSAAAQPYNILVEGTIPTSNGDGVHVDAGRQIRLLLSDVQAPSGKAITVGPSPLVGPNIEISGNGAETTWSYNIDPTSTQNVRTPGYPLLGNPATGISRSVAAGPPPDGTAVGGNPRGAQAVDLQTSRTRILPGRDRPLFSHSRWHQQLRAEHGNGPGRWPGQHQRRLFRLRRRGPGEHDHWIRRRTGRRHFQYRNRSVRCRSGRQLCHRSRPLRRGRLCIRQLSKRRARRCPVHRERAARLCRKRRLRTAHGRRRCRWHREHPEPHRRHGGHVPWVRDHPRHRNGRDVQLPCRVWGEASRPSRDHRGYLAKYRGKGWRRRAREGDAFVAS